jgi:hypothetical protein
LIDLDDDSPTNGADCISPMLPTRTQRIPQKNLQPTLSINVEHNFRAGQHSRAEEPPLDPASPFSTPTPPPTQLPAPSLSAHANFELLLAQLNGRHDESVVDVNAPISNNLRNAQIQTPLHSPAGSASAPRVRWIRGPVTAQQHPRSREI